MSPRKLWKVTAGIYPDIESPTDGGRPESRRSAYEIYVRHNVREGRLDWSRVWVDERGGRGWQLHEHIDHPRGGKR